MDFLGITEKYLDLVSFGLELYVSNNQLHPNFVIIFREENETWQKKSVSFNLLEKKI